MTAAHIGQGDSWLQRDETGCLDLPATVIFLREAMTVLDKARADIPASLEPEVAGIAGAIPG